MTEVEPRVEQNGLARAMPESAAADGEELLESLRRERADFRNYKRRVELERAEDRERTRAEVVQRLLPLLDELDRALQQLPDPLATNPWVQGVILSRQRLMAALRDLGVERVGTEGEPFDPAHHEAVFYDTQPGADEPRVTKVVQAGYRLGDQLLRPAQVGVAGPSEQTGRQVADSD